MEKSALLEAGREDFRTLILRQGGTRALEEHERLVTFPVRGGSEATAVFLSAEAANPILDSIRRNNPNMELEVCCRDRAWLADALGHRTDIDSVVTNASEVVSGNEDISAMSRRRFIELLQKGMVADAPH